MFECEDLTSAGFHDFFLNKFADSSGSIMDYFISDSMQDMLDIDIRAEVATVVGSASEFTTLVNDIPSSIEHDSRSTDSTDRDRWFGETKWATTSEIYADVGACVNPNSVMPLITSSVLNSPKSQINLNTNNFQHNSPLPSPKENKSHLTFSPNKIRVRSIEDIKRQNFNNNSPKMLTPAQRHQQQQQQQQARASSAIDVIKKDLTNELKDEKIVKNGISSNTPVIPATIAGGNTIKLAPGIGGLTFVNGMSYAKIKQQSGTETTTKIIRTANGNLMTQIKKECVGNELNSVSSQQHLHHNSNGTTVYTTNGLSSPKTTISSRNISMQTSSTNKIANNLNDNSITNHHHHQNHHQPQQNGTSSLKIKIKTNYPEFPKPPYSYSCLIAMSLKNSRSGSLPVSEIYSFMCEHFPYFKTAPNGWKNSVRHNLSLNKCFEKIEKPATNGGQRKGCLWAMNPTKISKMDEEVQKWSRKDPVAIRQAMVCPENLESLERGEMKHGSTGDSDGENDIQSDIEESSDIEADAELLDDPVIETSESPDDDEDEEKFDIEGPNIYDTIDIGDNKDTIQLTLHQNDIYELSDTDSPIAKKARLDINYSIAPASVFEHHSVQLQQSKHSTVSQQHQQQSHHHNRRKMQLVNRII